ncbi:hypothetical protein OsccyDRAFT_4759 [Leptolyngbyaceae cyanobacterium JSC-12]|nr:hypothetical protein OsccyDRAFT_4759 [Leptolyngbyaceae cyanobacterium JSC-12]
MGIGVCIRSKQFRSLELCQTHIRDSLLKIFLTIYSDISISIDSRVLIILEKSAFESITQNGRQFFTKLYFMLLRLILN